MTNIRNLIPNFYQGLSAQQQEVFNQLLFSVPPGHWNSTDIALENIQGLEQEQLSPEAVAVLEKARTHFTVEPSPDEALNAVLAASETNADRRSLLARSQDPSTVNSETPIYPEITSLSQIPKIVKALPVVALSAIENLPSLEAELSSYSKELIALNEAIGSEEYPLRAPLVGRDMAEVFFQGRKLGKPFHEEALPGLIFAGLINHYKMLDDPIGQNIYTNLSSFYRMMQREVNWDDWDDYLGDDVELDPYNPWLIRAAAYVSKRQREIQESDPDANSDIPKVKRFHKKTLNEAKKREAEYQKRYETMVKLPERWGHTGLRRFAKDNVSELLDGETLKQSWSLAKIYKQLVGIVKTANKVAEGITEGVVSVSTGIGVVSQLEKLKTTCKEVHVAGKIYELEMALYFGDYRGAVFLSNKGSPLEKQWIHLVKAELNRRLKREIHLETVPQLGEHNVERLETLAELDRMLEAGKVLSIEGIPGSGKTYLAAQLAYKQPVGRRPIFWYTFRQGQEPDVGLALDHLAAFLEKQSSESERGLLTSVQSRERMEEKVPIVAAALKRNAALLFFDNFHEVMGRKWSRNIFTELVQDGIGDSTIIDLVTITRQHGNWLKRVKAEHWSQKGLADKEARLLLENIGAASEITEEQFQDLYSKTGGLPQALVLFGEAIQARKPQEVQKVIDNIPEGDQSEVLGYLFETVYEKLTDNQQLLLEYLSVFRRPVPEDAVVEVAIGEVTGIRKGVRYFRKVFLLEERAPELFELHDALKTLAYNYIDDPRILHHRIADYYKLNQQGPDDIIEAAHHYFKAEKYDSAVEIITGATANLMSKGYLGGVQELLKRFDETIPLTDINRGRIYYERGILCYFLGEWDKALGFYKKSLKIFEELSDRQGMADSYGNMANVYESLGEWDKALGFFNDSLEIYKELGDRQGMAISYGNMANVYESQGEWDKALGFSIDSFKIFEELGDRRGMATFYTNMGNVYRSIGERDNALEFHKKSLKIFEELGDRRGIASIYNNMGIVYGSQGEWDKALGFFIDSLEIYKELGDRRGMAITYHNMGVMYRSLGEWDKALKFFNDSLEIFEDFGLQSNIETVQAAIDEMLRIKSEGDSHDD